MGASTQSLLVAIKSPDATVAQIAEVAAVELPYEQRPAFLQTVLENIRQPEFGDAIELAPSNIYDTFANLLRFRMDPTSMTKLRMKC